MNRGCDVAGAIVGHILVGTRLVGLGFLIPLMWIQVGSGWSPLHVELKVPPCL